MKYLAIAIGYLLVWSLLIPYIIIERCCKVLWIIILVLWHFKWNRVWLEIFDTYFVVIPFPIIVVFLTWEISNLKDLLLLRKWELWIEKK